MYPDLIKAIVLAAIVKMRDHSKRQLVSTLKKRREKAEDALAACVVVELSRRS